MPESYGPRARAHHLVGVAAALQMHMAVAPSASRIRRHSAPRASLRSLAGVDDQARIRPTNTRSDASPPVNRRPDLYTPDTTEFSPDYAWNQNFNDGNQNNNDKNNRLRCRAVRK